MRRVCVRLYAAKMPGCAIATCHNYNRRTKGTNIIYHRFPKEKIIQRQWILKCKRADKFTVENARVCSAHFTPEDYQRDLKHELLGGQPKNHLKPTAIPSLNLPYPKNAPSCEAYRQLLEKLRRKPARKGKGGDCLPADKINARNVNAELTSAAAKEVPNIQATCTGTGTATCVGNYGDVRPHTVEELPRPVDVELGVPAKELPNIKNTATCILPIVSDHGFDRSGAAVQHVSSRMMRLHAREVRKRALDRMRCLSPQNVPPKTVDAATNTDDAGLESVRIKIEALTNQVERLKKLNAALKLRFNKQEMLRKQITVLERRCKTSENQTKQNYANVEAIHLKLKDSFTTSQITCLMSGKTKARWGEEDLYKALTLWEISKKSYSYVRKHMGLPLPGGATLRRWKSQLPVLTEDNKEQTEELGS